MYFDIGFLRYELHAAGLLFRSPYLCLMYMRPLLNLGSRCSLAVACREVGIDLGVSHLASSDALAAARLWPIYLDEMRRQNMQTFGDLAAGRSHKFFASFGDPPFDAMTAARMKSAARMKPRGGKKDPGSFISLGHREAGQSR